MAQIPDRVLPLSATVKRYTISTGDYTITVYTGLKCMIGRKTNFSNNNPTERSSTTQGSILICRLTNPSGNPYDIRLEDRVEIGTKKYRVLGVANACSMGHHLEIDIQLLQTMDKAE